MSTEPTSRFSPEMLRAISKAYASMNEGYFQERRNLEFAEKDVPLIAVCFAFVIHGLAWMGIL